MTSPPAGRMLALAMAAFGAWRAMGACQRSHGQDATPTASRRAETAVARLELQPRFELGSMAQEEAVERRVALRNAGTRPLEIQRVEPSRFCTGSMVNRTIAPGASGELKVVCRTDMYGPIRESLLLHTNDPGASRATLELVATVTPRLAFDATTVDLKMPFGEERSQTVRLVGSQAERARIKLTDPGHAAFQTALLPAREGKAPGLSIRCRGNRVGTHVGSVRIATGIDQPAELALPCSCKVIGTLEISPTNPYFNLKVSGPKMQWISVRSSQPDFELRGVQVTEGPYSATFERGQGGEFRVKVTVLEQRLDHEARSASGKLVISSNDRTEPKREVPLFGFGRVNKE